MIRPLRQRHRVMVFALSVVVPVAFAVGIETRKTVPNQAGTAGHPSAEIWNHNQIWTRDDLWGKATIRTRLLSDGTGAPRFAIELISKAQIVRPDVLVYWVPNGGKVEDSLSADAFLLGSFDQSAPAPLALPIEAIKIPGTLVLYSLADHEILAVSKPFTSTR